MKSKNPRAFDLIGNIAVVKFPRETKEKENKAFAEGLLKKQNSIKTVLEKYGKIKGRLRKTKTRYIAGIKTKEVLYKENGCVFKFNIDATYFSPRLSNERKEIAGKIKKNAMVLVMFAGVAPFSIVIGKNSSAKMVLSNEINREANKYAKLNIELNGLKGKVELLQGDLKKVTEKLKKQKKKFETIVMPRPQLKSTFLKQAFALSKRNTVIYYYDFCKKEETDLVINKIKEEAKKSRKKIKILKKKVAGEIAPYKIRLRVDFRVLN